MRTNKVVKQIKKWSTQEWLILVLVLVGLVLRAWKFWYFPIIGATQDEVAWTLLGSSLLQTGVPISWSHFGGYKVIETLWAGSNSFPLVKPVLDHPPLFSLIPGIWNTLLGHGWNAIPDIKYMRMPMVGLSMANLLLFVFWIRTQVKDKVWQLVSIGLAVTVPSIIFMSRLVVSENLLVTWMLLMLILQQARWKKFKWWPAAVVLIHAAAPLTKISGLALWVGSLVAGWVHDKRWFKWSLLGGLLGSLLLLIYVATYDWNLFWVVQLQQASRTTGLLTLFSTWIWKPTLASDLLAEPWTVLGLGGLLALTLITSSQNKNRLNNFVVWLFLAQLAFLLLSVGEHTYHGWYRIVFWPLWSYALGWIISEVVQKKYDFMPALLWIISLPVIRLGLIAVWGHAFYQYQGTINKLLLVLAGSTLLPLIYKHPLTKKWPRYSLMLLALLLVLVQVGTVILLTHETFWEDSLYLREGIKP